MSYSLKFLPIALKEWKKIPPNIQAQFKQKLRERLENPHVPSAKLRGYSSVYKIKLRTVGYRLVYEVIDNELVVYVLAVGRRNKNAVYNKLKSRID
ncbi:type II toxin-antitoxin system RelE/ParE family toxin [Pasteurella skyensis]|uniref:Type II toxin-antitoxin system RelE/ParE family toxin n=1 Tax=Phocoenobacter skyensis TaxID=97481 RepID=A0AAJ6NBL9_9PAST|nr:type II toxin-antitoxin system RelE/ParE family toxin [Pasteurella skyensis]MDP8163511.1 type II toxin-antitoxin system RelE/ParE family toxin [Pasteurella skyensis]MDP8173827.1 type II toxin-antitoxin system RelE/ParE family toxin [Pasteurella skyensis]MDP8177127.1 type II toxin-antitoxin system RelE/ParE family toxin [Pasteurella skyensis]MDP8179984.1 type II toxin-antitoxin system RelE/ParE family toxin [Pasteurella skyensis]MDP8184075.1 type II toxin-antitoxin system RelE/ParE family to